MENPANLPPDLAHHRVLDSKEAASFLNISLPHFRRMYRAGDVPRPLKLSARKLGWRARDLIDWIDARASQNEAA